MSSVLIPIRLILILIPICFIDCAKILLISPIAVRSHHQLGQKLMEGLTDHGHDVTFMSAFKIDYQPKNGSLQVIHLPKMHVINELVSDWFVFDQTSPFLLQFLMCWYGNIYNDIILGNDDVQKLLRSNRTFDVVIVEQFQIDSLKYLANYFNAHLVLLSTLGTNIHINSLVGNPAVPYLSESGVYNYYGNFWDRLHNFLLHYFTLLCTNLIVIPEENRIIKKYFPNAPDLQEIQFNTSLVLLNSHISTNQPVPFVPCMIDIGGFHVNPPKGLPGDLQNFLDEAEDGVIYFSMGSNLNSSKLSKDKRNAILNNFAKLKEKVLWKWEIDDLPGKPPNVFIQKWFPQQDILAHPNVKLFITHGGLLSTIETVYFGVPILAIPVYGDQKSNAAFAEKEGYAVVVKFSELDETTFGTKLHKIINNQKYTENVRKISKIFHDRPQKPMDTAIYWLEYVIRHNGAKHLRVAALELAWYQNASLDIITFILVIIIFVNYFIYIFCIKVYDLISLTKPKMKKS